MLTSATQTNADGLQWTFSYPAASVTNFSVTPGPVLISAGKTVSCAGGANAYICLTNGLNTNTILDGNVAVVTVTLAPGAGSFSIGVSDTLGASVAGYPIPVSGTGGNIFVATSVTSLACTPSSLSSGGTSNCTVSLSAAAASPVMVGLSSNLPALMVPSSVTIPTGSFTAPFTATAGTLSSDQTATLTASLNGSSTSASVSLVAPVRVSSLFCSPASLGPNASSTCTVTLNKAAPTGGANISLSNNNPTLTVPPFVTVAAGTTAATFNATTGALLSDQTAIVTASFNGSSLPTTLSLVAAVPVNVSALQCTPSIVTSNTSIACTLTLAKAFSSNTMVPLSSSAPFLLTVPSAVIVAANATSATFFVSIGTILSDQSATITATVNGTSVTTTVSSAGAAATLSALQCAPSTLASNASATCTVTLSKSASSGTVVSLANSAPSVLTVPSSVTVPANANSATFTASTGTIPSDQSATITATLNGTSLPTSLSLIGVPATLSSLQCAPATLASNASATCTVTLSKSAISGTVISLANSAPSVLTVASSVTIPANANSATFPASTGTIPSDQSATITASLNGTSLPTTISLLGAAATLSALQCAPATLASNASATCTVTLSKSASSGTVVSLANSAPSVLTVASSVTVPANANSATFTASTGTILSDQAATITATLNGASLPTNLSLVAAGPVNVSSLQCAPSTVASNASTACTLSLSKAAPSNTWVTLSGSAPFLLTVPSAAIVAANTTSATFFAATGSLLSDQSAIITATLNGSSMTTTLSLVTTDATVTLNSLQCDAASLPSNSSTTCTVTLSKSTASSTVVTLANSAPSALSVPSSVTIAANATSAIFIASTGELVSDQTATLMASLNGSSKPATLSLVAPLTLSDITVSSITANGATIHWTTNKGSDSQVTYGATPAYGSASALGLDPVTSHTVNLTGLAPSTIYHYKIVSRDAQGTPADSGDFTITTRAGTESPVLFQLHSDATEISGVTNGAIVTPAVAPSGFAGNVVINSGGSVNFAPAQEGNGVYFLNCCDTSANAYYKFPGSAVGSVFNMGQGQISFYLKSRHTFAQRLASGSWPQQVLDVRDASAHLFQFVTAAGSNSLVFGYTVAGATAVYVVPPGTEEALFGEGITLKVAMMWDGSVARLYLNDNLVQQSSYLTPTPNWDASSNFVLGAYEDLTSGTHYACDDIIDEFTVAGGLPEAQATLPTIAPLECTAAGQASNESTTCAVTPAKSRGGDLQQPGGR